MVIETDLQFSPSIINLTSKLLNDYEYFEKKGCLLQDYKFER